MSTEKTLNKESNSEMITREDIPNSPFTVVGVTDEKTEERKYFGTMGKYRITEPKETEREIIEELEEMTWNRIVQVILIMLESRDGTLQEAMKENV